MNKKVSILSEALGHPGGGTKGAIG